MNAVVAALLLFPQISQEPGPVRPGFTILVEPNVLITRDPASRFLEPFIAADPENSQRLVVGAIGRSSEAGSKSRAFWSADGGKTWSESALPRHGSGGDPYVAFGARGRAYFSTLSSDPDSLGRRGRAVDVYRSDNSGESWEEPLRLPTGRYADYEKIAVDLNAPGKADRVYVVTKATGGSLLFRSDDGARTFGPPTVVHPDFVHVSSLAVQRNGNIVLPYARENLRNPQDPAWTHIVIVTSRDGGKTFSKPMPVASPDRTCLNRGPQGPDSWTIDFAKFLAIDRSTFTYAGRIYVVWTDCRFGKSRILLAWSADGGTSWSQPRRLDSQVPDSATQLLPAIAVNREGVVGVSWLDTRHSISGERFDAYFAASTDGGESFLPAVRVSSQSSLPSSAENRTLELGEVSRSAKGITAFLNSAYAHRPEGGDYLGLASDAEGGFHYAWADSRTGSSQIWTSRIRVVPTAAPNAAGSAGHLPIDVTEKVALEFDRLLYDAGRQEHVLWIRLRNVSPGPICRPLTLHVNAWPQLKLELANADNNKGGVGAMFDYSGAMRDLDRLRARGVTEPLAWRTRGSTAGYEGSIVSFSAKVTAATCE